MVHFGQRKSCFNTQPPEGGWIDRRFIFRRAVCFNTQPPEGGWKNSYLLGFVYLMFQHAAARRRLVDYTDIDNNF